MDLTRAGGTLGFIPPPPFDHIGPFRIYGLMIAIGVLVAVMIAQRRWSKWGGDEEAIVSIAVWAVPAGLIGARLYHVITDWETLYSDGRWVNAFKIYNGGLGIPGGVLAGAIVGVIVARRTVPSWRRLGDAVAPALPVAQAIGRLGNYFNQELYGRATDLPWALRVDNRIVEVQNPEQLPNVTFHPTFLYEGLWNLALAGLIVWGGTKFVLKPGRWFAFYIAGYGLGRLWVESLRIDPATHVFGLRVNIWMSLVIIAFGLIWFMWGGGPVDRDSTELLRNGADPADLFGEETAFATVGAPEGAVEGEGEAAPSEGSGPDDSAGPDDPAGPDEVAGSHEVAGSADATGDDASAGDSDRIGESGPESD